MKIFWSWQSDTHQPTGRYFVREVLRSVAEELKGEDNTDEAERPEASAEIGDDDAGSNRIEVDYDTLGVGGSPKIADKILEKIEAAAVFVADLTPIATTRAGKMVPNPNVMIELGYALKVLGNERIVLVMNQAEGAALAKLPFDLRHWRQPVTYKLRRDASDEQKAEAAQALKEKLTGVIAPALLKAAKQVKAAKPIVREPLLVVDWATEGGGIYVARREPSLRGFATLDQIKERTPLLDPDPPPDIIYLGRESASPPVIPVSNMQAVERWSRQQRAAHNEKVEAYYRSYERYLDKQKEYERLMIRSLDVDLLLKNIGTAPATDIDLEIQFPDFITFFGDRGELPEPPKTPSPPAPTLYPFSVPEIAATRFPDHMSSLVRQMDIDPEARRVSFHFRDLKHHREEVLDTFSFSFETPEALSSFDADYVITAAEPIEPFRGKIRFELKYEDEA